MNEEYYVKSLKRLYDEADKIQQRENHISSPGVLETYNELLPELQQEFPDNEVIQSMEEVTVSTSLRGGVPVDNLPKMQKVKMNTLRMADALGVEVEDFERRASAEGMTVIHVTQSVEQSVDVSIEGVMQIVNNLPREETEKDELREIVELYQEEMQSESPDASKMRDLIDRAREYSKDVAVKLAMVGLQKGIDLLV